MRKLRVDWHGSETNKLVELVFLMRLNDTGSTLLQLFNRAQKQLPEDRRRKIGSLKLVPWLEPALAERISDLKNKANRNSQAKTIPQPPLPPLNINKVLEDMSTEEFFLILSRRLCQTIESLDLRVNQRLSRLENLLSQFLSKSANTPEIEKPKKQRIVIVGLLPEQYQEIEKACNGRVELNFMRKDQDAAEIPNCDFIILSRFITHRWSDKAKLAMPKDRIFFIDGGVSSIIKKVFELGSRQ